MKNKIQDQARKVKDEAMKVAGKVMDTVDEGRKVVEKMRATVSETRERGTKKVESLVSELPVKDLIEKASVLKVEELIEKLKSPEVRKHVDAVRAEVLAFLRLPGVEMVEKIQADIEKLTKEVAGLKTLKAELKKVADKVETARAKKAKTEA